MTTDELARRIDAAAAVAHEYLGVDSDACDELAGAMLAAADCAVPVAPVVREMVERAGAGVGSEVWRLRLAGGTSVAPR